MKPLRIYRNIEYEFYHDSVHCTIKSSMSGDGSVFRSYINGDYTEYKAGSLEEAVNHILSRIGIEKKARQLMIKKIQIIE